MKIFPAETVQEIDKYTIENEPIASIDLMERAASRLVDWFVRNYRPHRKVVVIAGPGNNGGDALAAARMLMNRNYRVSCYLVSSSRKLSEDCQVNLDRLGEVKGDKVQRISSANDIPGLNGDELVIDGIFGSGLSRVVEGVYRNVIDMINNSGAEVISIDIPSGLFGEDNTENDPDAIIRAAHTLTFQFPFLSFFFAENEPFTGRWHVIYIGLHEEIIERKETPYKVISKDFTAGVIPDRTKFSHKGSYGHGLVVAGSYGMMGAALLSGEAALRTGAGLVSIHIPAAGYEIIQTAFPEAIVSLDPHEHVFSAPPDLEKYDAIAAGPGLGTGSLTREAIKTLLEKAKVPLVLDADALNIIGELPELVDLIPPGTILTPHPLEFDRIAGTSGNGWERHLKQKAFAEKYGVIVVLKGAYTGISLPGGEYYLNMTGNPGMATGGSGDVLTGMILSFLAQGVKPVDAAFAAVYLHGSAGDIAAEKAGEESLIAGDIIKQLGAAFKKVQAEIYLHEGRSSGIFQ